MIVRMPSSSLMTQTVVASMLAAALIMPLAVAEAQPQLAPSLLQAPVGAAAGNAAPATLVSPVLASPTVLSSNTLDTPVLNGPTRSGPATPVRTLSLEQSIRGALYNSPEIGIARQKVFQARSSIREAQGAQLPQIDLYYATGREFNSPAGQRSRQQTHGDYSNSDDMGFGITQLLFDGFRTDSEIERLRRDFTGSQYRSQAVTLKIAQQMSSAFLDIYQGKQVLDTVDTFVARLEDLSAKMDINAQEGNASQTLQKYVSSRLANARQVRVQVLNNLQNSAESYAFLAKQPINVSSTTLLIPRLPPLESLEHYQAQMLAFNPELQARIADRDSARQEVAKAKGNYYPSVKLDGQFDQSSDVGGKVGQQRVATGLVKVNYRLYDGGTRSAALERTRSQVTENDLQIQRTQLKLDQDLRTSWQDLQARLEERKLVDQEINDSTTVRNLREREFMEGQGDLVRLVEAEEQLFGALRQRLVLDSRILGTRFDVEFITGRPHLMGPPDEEDANLLRGLQSYSNLLEQKSHPAPKAEPQPAEPIVESPATAIPAKGKVAAQAKARKSHSKAMSATVAVMPLRTVPAPVATSALPAMPTPQITIPVTGGGPLTAAPESTSSATGTEQHAAAPFEVSSLAAISPAAGPDTMVAETTMAPASNGLNNPLMLNQALQDKELNNLLAPLSPPNGPDTSPAQTAKISKTGYRFIKR